MKSLVNFIKDIISLPWYFELDTEKCWRSSGTCHKQGSKKKNYQGGQQALLETRNTFWIGKYQIDSGSSSWKRGKIVFFKIMNGRNAKQKDFSKFLTTEELGNIWIKISCNSSNLIKRKCCFHPVCNLNCVIRRLFICISWNNN